MDLDWKRAFALHLWCAINLKCTSTWRFKFFPNFLTCVCILWDECEHFRYMCPPTAPAQITKALEEYEMGCSGDSPLGMYCSPPLPPYLEEDQMGDTENIRDTAYHLLKLYSERTYALESLFNPRSSSSNHMDYRLRFVGEILDWYEWILYGVVMRYKTTWYKW